MKVLKFGGTSVGSPENIQKVIDIVLKTGTKNLAIVVSAQSGITDQLISIGKLAAKSDQNYKDILKEIKQRHFVTVEKLISSKNHKKVLEKVNEFLEELEEIAKGIFMIKECSKRSLDLICSFGERLSAYIISQSLNEKFDTEYLDARKIIVTDNNFTSAKVDFVKTDQKVQKYFKEHNAIQLVTGFIGSTEENETTTLGRGGSDYTASILGAALNAEAVEIWTDVDGVMTADPRKVKKAFPIDNLSYEEAMEMTHFGAKVIHPPTMQPVMNKNIPLWIKNTTNPEHPGSLISSKSKNNGFPIKGISSISKIALLRLQGSGMIGVTGTSQRLFGCLAREKINIILITQASSEHSICLAINPEEAEKAKAIIEEEFSLEIRAKQIDPVVVEKDLSIIAVVGENMRKTPGIAGKFFQALGKNGVNISAIAQGSSELNISAVISNQDEIKALNIVHDSFFLSNTKTLNIFLAGTGLIGSTLLKQIYEQHNQIKKDQSLEIKIIGLCNYKKSFINENGISLDNWEKQLETGSENNLKDFINKMFELNLANSIFVDCTASEEITVFYPEILKNSISIVTPNKKANSDTLANYLKLSLAASKSNAKFLYETNVGAGLPILSTLNDLQYSGDKIVKIEAVLSGTLSYIFNNYSSPENKKSLTEIVKEAKEKGYTEPDPRDDLNGLDVARKLLILARETGQLFELKDIEVESLVPEGCKKAKSVEEFFELFKKAENNFEQKYKNELHTGKKLCYIASLQGKKAKISLQVIDQNHPFFGLSGSDNIISLTTNRYKERPLVIKGPGAGAEVTASGVFADILRISNISFNTPLMRYAFAENLKKNKLMISLIGMSNIGKTFWSKKLSKLGFKHINCDDLIENKLAPILQKRGYKGINDVAKWLGQPYDKQFNENQKEYLNLEETTMQSLFENENSENTVIDTTGSVIYTSEKALDKLKKNSLVIYIESSEEMKKEMYENYLKEPKPVIWGNCYKQTENETKEDALKKCYMKLLEERAKKYKKIADIVIPYHEISKDNMDAVEFLSLIQEKL